MEYLHVLSRPKVIDQEHDTVWTEAYIDSTVSRPRHPSPTSLNPLNVINSGSATMPQLASILIIEPLELVN